MTTSAIEVRIPADIPTTIGEGARNVTLTRLAGALRAQGLGGDALLEALQHENQARCVPPLPEREVWSIAQSVGRYEPGEQRYREPNIRTRYASKQANKQASREWPTLEAPPEAWQERARAFARYAQGQLWQMPRALKYLRDRGLTDDTIRRAGLGWNPKDLRDSGSRWGLSGGSVWLSGGWVIPNESGGVGMYGHFGPRIMWGVNVRRPDGAEPKYMCVRGSKRKVYGLDWIGHHSDLVLVEGEFDALLLAQEVPVIISVIALGGSENRPDIDSLRVLAGFRRWWLALDADEAGRNADAEVCEMTERARTLSMPRQDCNDVTDLWRAGEDLVPWIVSQVGPQDNGDYVRWAEHYMDTVEDEVFESGADTTPPVARVWHALLQRYDRVRQSVWRAD